MTLPPVAAPAAGRRAPCRESAPARAARSGHLIEGIIITTRTSHLESFTMSGTGYNDNALSGT